MSDMNQRKTSEPTPPPNNGATARSSIAHDHTPTTERTDEAALPLVLANFVPLQGALGVTYSMI